MSPEPSPETPRSLSAVRSDVLPMLDGSTAFRGLPHDERRELVDKMVRATDAAARALAVRRSGDPAAIEELERLGAIRRDDARVDAIDFPGFVSALIQATFKAIVDASIAQMEAYAELVESVAKSVDDFMHDHLAEDRAATAHRPYLAECDRRGRAAERQRLLSTIVLMGINRIVVSEGRISAGVVVDLGVRPDGGGRAAR